MATTARYGSRLSDADYQRETVALAHRYPDGSSEAEVLAYERREFNLLVNHRLGVGFPEDRRERLWAIRRRIHRRIAWHLLRGMLVGNASGGLAKGLAQGFAQELDRTDLEQMLGLTSSEVDRLLR